jgi:hypothetical protein
MDAQLDGRGLTGSGIRFGLTAEAQIGLTIKQNDADPLGAEMHKFQVPY